MLWHDVACYFFLLCFRAWSRDTRETRCIVKHPERKRQETPTSTPTGVSGGGSLTGMYNVTPEGKAPIVQTLGDVKPGPIYTQKAVETVFPDLGAPFVAVALFFFAFTTIMAYYYMAETNIAYLGRLLKWKNVRAFQFALKIVMLGVVFYGSVKTAELAWMLGDIGVGSMAWLNLIAILLLAKPALKVLKDYEQQKKEGRDPVFDPAKLGIEGADFWEYDYKARETKAASGK